ncbi:MAG: hypothetical protein ACXABY_25230 [Candidatus Thorarchaeota archaeon]|jgi:hypothetical protein
MMRNTKVRYPKSEPDQAGGVEFLVFTGLGKIDHHHFEAFL